MLRLALHTDIPALFDVRTRVRENHLDMEQLAERGVTHDSIAGMLAGDETRTWVIDDDGEVRGFSMADARDGSVFALFVAPGFERLGYGRSLLQAAEQWLFSRGWVTIWLNTGQEPWNRSHSVYRAAGWTVVGEADHGDVRYEKTRPG
jgi:GNAT superfamily N-acetyltransferase